MPIRNPAVLACVPRPVQAQISHYGQVGGPDEQHVIGVRWPAAQGKACRLCPRDVCTFREHPDGEGLCTILVRGRVPADLVRGLGLARPV